MLPKPNYKVFSLGTDTIMEQEYQCHYIRRQGDGMFINTKCKNSETK